MKNEHRKGCVCIRCEAASEAAALERVYEKLTTADRERSAASVLAEAIVDARGRMVEQ